MRRRTPSKYDPAKARARLLKRYGLKPEDYARLLLAQNGKCALCLRTPGTRMLDIDHDHKTRALRGLLCHRCNRALGHITSIDMAERIPDYLAINTGYLVPKKKRRR